MNFNITNILSDGRYRLQTGLVLNYFRDKSFVRDKEKYSAGFKEEKKTEHHPSPGSSGAGRIPEQHAIPGLPEPSLNYAKQAKKTASPQSNFKMFIAKKNLDFSLFSYNYLLAE
ncbi:hypothetical protein CEXT_48411 [Caerostris extrusa]|uniref:Uncharacterized protein n=1 Tax=Caerostris extrusa TaxID=172846 RepID=A0AAV4N0Y0_CAEEX|nr:hypothetical protein CEXT_48411 [Caerostris extrusa]